jgi:hypothetical protein
MTADRTEALLAEALYNVEPITDQNVDADGRAVGKPFTYPWATIVECFPEVEERFMKLAGAAMSATLYASSSPSDARYQARVGDWMMACFGADITNSLMERCYRFFEGASELCQALGMSADMAHQLVDYTWGRDKGEPSQEVGGVMVTLAALCFAAGLDMEADGETELSRISAPEIMDKIRRKHAAKVLRTPHSALPGIDTSTASEDAGNE